MQVHAELHCHTRYSDGWSTPETCIRWAARKGLQIIAITDHNTAEGGFRYWQAPIQNGVLVVPGEEISTDLGHVLAFFVRQTISPGPFDQVLGQIRIQGAFPFMAHPYHIPLGNRWRQKPIYRLRPEQLSQLAGVEVENGHNRPRANAFAAKLAEDTGLCTISGSDAHFPWEIGNARTVIEVDALTHAAVRAALLDGRLKAMPCRVSAYGVYLGVGLINRLSGRRYAWKGT